MRIVVNDEAREVATSLKLAQLLEQLKMLGRSGVAVAVNDAVVPKKEWENFELSESDTVLLITATQGG